MSPSEVGDDIKVKRTKSRLIQGAEYYAYGMQTAGSWTRDGQTENNFLANGGTELNRLTGLYDLDYRQYDPVLGRMNQVDPAAAKYASLSPYNFGFNNPVMWNDPMGADPHEGDNGSEDDFYLRRSRQFGGLYGFGGEGQTIDPQTYFGGSTGEANFNELARYGFGGNPFAYFDAIKEEARQIRFRSAMEGSDRDKVNYTKFYGADLHVAGKDVSNFFKLGMAIVRALGNAIATSPEYRNLTASINSTSIYPPGSDPLYEARSYNEELDGGIGWIAGDLEDMGSTRNMSRYKMDLKVGVGPSASINDDGGIDISWILFVQAVSFVTYPGGNVEATGDVTLYHNGSEYSRGRLQPHQGPTIGFTSNKQYSMVGEHFFVLPSPRGAVRFEFQGSWVVWKDGMPSVPVHYILQYPLSVKTTFYIK